MLMKSGVAALALGLSLVAAADDYKIDPDHTYVYFAVQHAGLALTYGRFNKVSGQLSIDRASGTGALSVVIDAASVDTNHQKRDDHLRSPDFLNVVEFPDITYKSTGVTFTGENQATVQGDLTILGVSQPVTLQVSGIVCEKHMFYNYDACGFDATATVKRSAFGMSYGLPKGVGDELRLFISAEAAKQ